MLSKGVINMKKDLPRLVFVSIGTSQLDLEFALTAIFVPAGYIYHALFKVFYYKF